MQQTGIVLNAPKQWRQLLARVNDLLQPYGQASGHPVGQIGAVLFDKLAPKLTHQEKAWTLIYAALVESMDRVLEPHLEKWDRSLHELAARFDLDLNLERLELPMSFLVNPKSLPVLNRLAELARKAVGEKENDEEIALLPGSFVQILHAMSLKDREAYRTLPDLLQSPLALAEARGRAWQSYAVSESLKLHEPLFNEPFCLFQLYQPLRGYWIENGDQEIWHLHDLSQTFERWVNARDPDDRLRVLCGGPGSGKSSFTKMFAYQLLSRTETYPVLRLELQHINSFHLEEQINRFAKRKGIKPSPVDEEGGHSWPLIVLDGLDELEVQGSRGEQAVMQLVKAVDDLIADTAETYVLPLFLLAGRTIIVQAVKDQLNRPEQIFHLAGYFRFSEEDENQQSSDNNNKTLWNDPNSLIQEDQRVDWYKKYTLLKTGKPKELPKFLEDLDNKMAQLSKEPILLHLMTMSRIEAFDKNSSINEIYQELLEEVFKRSWAKSSGNKTTKQLPELKKLRVKDLWELFEIVGLTVWQRGNSRNAKTNDIKSYLECKLKEKYEDFLADAKKGAFALLTGFFFKQIEGEGEPTFELTHKSFGEYLSAKKLMRFARDHCKELNDLPAWFSLTHQARITPEIIDFLEGEFRVLGFKQSRKLRNALISLFNKNLQQGMPFESRNRDEAIVQAANAELALLCMIGAASRAIDDFCINNGKLPEERQKTAGWKPVWPDERSPDGTENKNRTSLKDLINRLQYRTAYDELTLKAMRGMNISNQRFVALAAVADWCVSTAVHADLTRADLTRANLTAANFRSANLNRADLFTANLTSANLTSANFTAANLTAAILYTANLSRADLTRADLTRVNLTDANLTQADLTLANLTRADLTFADLTSANLTRTNLTRTNLTFADFTSANLTRTNLTGAKGLKAMQLLEARTLLGAIVDHEIMKNPEIARRVKEDPID